MHFELIQELQQKPVIALVGATNDRTKYGNVIFKDLRRKRFKVIPVNHRATTVEKEKAYPDLKSALADFGDIGMVVYVVPPKMTLASLKEAVSQGLKKAWFQPGASDGAVLDYAEAEGLRYLVDRCVMVETV